MVATLLNETLEIQNVTNSTVAISEMFQQKEMEIPLLVFCIFLFVFGIIGNLFIVIFFVTKKRMESMATYHIWIMLLAISDMCTCISGFAFFVVIRDQKCFSIALTRTSNVCMLVTIFALCGVSYDRYRAIAKPFSCSRKRLKTVITYLSMIFIAGWLEYLYIYLEPYFKTAVQFLMTYSVIYLLTDCLIPVGFMFFLYQRLSTKLSDLSKPLRQQTLNTRKSLIKRNQEALRVIKALNIIYVVNVVPVRVTKIVLEFIFCLNLHPNYNMQIMVGIQFTMMLLYVNNCLNCVIYAGRMLDFRKFLLKAFIPWKTFEKQAPTVTASIRQVSGQQSSRHASIRQPSTRHKSITNQVPVEV